MTLRGVHRLKLPQLASLSLESNKQAKLPKSYLISILFSFTVNPLVLLHTLCWLKLSSLFKLSSTGPLTTGPISSNYFISLCSNHMYTKLPVPGKHESHMAQSIRGKTPTQMAWQSGHWTSYGTHPAKARKHKNFRKWWRSDEEFSITADVWSISLEVHTDY